MVVPPTVKGVERAVKLPVLAGVVIEMLIEAEVVKVAVTERAAVIDTVQVPVPGQEISAPLQPEKVKPLAGVGVAFRMMLLPAVTVSVQSPGHRMRMPDGLLLTLPVTLPLPVTLTLRVNCAGGGTGVAVNVAVTVRFVLMVRAQLVVLPLQSPLHPVNV